MKKDWKNNKEFKALNKERKAWKKLLGCDCKEVKTCTCLIIKYT